MRADRRDPLGTVPLFEAPPAVGKRRRPKAQRPVAWGKCPMCTAERTAVIRSAHHHLWREHRYRTYSGAQLVCPSSLVALCMAPDRNGATCCPHS